MRLTLQPFWNEALKSQRRSVFYFCTDFEPIWTVEGQCLKKLIGERRQRQKEDLYFTVGGGSFISHIFSIEGGREVIFHFVYFLKQTFETLPPFNHGGTLAFIRISFFFSKQEKVGPGALADSSLATKPFRLLISLEGRSLLGRTPDLMHPRIPQLLLCGSVPTMTF